MFDLLGPDLPLAAKFFIAFAVVLALIGLTAWLVRRFGSNRLGGGTRGRQPRLAVIDAAAVDGRRRLVLIRRDNVEHLLMIGGPSDVVIEPNIVRAVGAREMAREQPGRATPEVTARAAPEAAVRATPPAENTWPLQPEPAPILPTPRPYRSSATEEPWVPPSEPGLRARPGPDLSELAGRFNAPDVSAPIVRAEPRVAASLAGESLPSPQSDHNLAEMAQQLEAALRRAPVGEARPPVTDPLAASSNAAGKFGEPQRFPPPRDMRPRAEAKIEPKPETKLEPKLEPAATQGKDLYDNLEQEMASLLGRPPGKP